MPSEGQNTPSADPKCAIAQRWDCNAQQLPNSMAFERVHGTLSLRRLLKRNGRALSQTKLAELLSMFLPKRQVLDKSTIAHYDHAEEIARSGKRPGKKHRMSAAIRDALHALIVALVEYVSGGTRTARVSGVFYWRVRVVRRLA